MLKFYEKHRVLFAVILIVVYCVTNAPIKEKYGYGSIQMLLLLAAFTVAIAIFVKAGHLEEDLGLKGWPKNMKKLLYLIPMFVVATGNVWDGFAPSFTGTALLYATLSMALVGFVEEAIFRGFLFKGMLAEGSTVAAIVVSSLTFGLGHIVNMFAGQASFETFIQMIFAITWGFIFTMVYYKGGKLWPCIIAHSMIDVLAELGADNGTANWVSIIATIIVGIVYCIYLSRLETPVSMRAENKKEICGGK